MTSAIGAVVTESESMVDCWPDEILSDGPRRVPSMPARLRIVHPSGASEMVDLPVERWHAPAGYTDTAVLSRARSPVLDIGCGPGRHVVALIAAGQIALGIDVSHAAVRATGRRGGPAVRVSVFGQVPAAGAWATALLLDGNIGIGGDPGALLTRVAVLLAPGGTALVELDRPGVTPGQCHAHVLHFGRVGPRFPWARVGPTEIAETAGAAGLSLADVWSAGDRWFAQLDRR